MDSSLGGYFAVTYISEPLLLQMLDQMWETLWKDARGAISRTLSTPVGSLSLTGAISLAKPNVEFLSSSDQVRVKLRASCRLSVSLDGDPGVGTFIEASATTVVPIRLIQATTYDQAKLDLQLFSITAGQVGLTFFDGNGTASLSTALQSTAVLTWLSDELRSRADRFLVFTLPTNRLFATYFTSGLFVSAGQIVLTPILLLRGVRVLDGYLAMGIDNNTQNDTKTQGDASAIGPPPLMPDVDRTVILVIDGELVRKFLERNVRIALNLTAPSYPNIHLSGQPTVVIRELPTNLPTLHPTRQVVEVHSSGTIDAPDPLSGSFPFDATIRVEPVIQGGFGVNAGAVVAYIAPDVKVQTPDYINLIALTINFYTGIDVFKQLNSINQGTAVPLFTAEGRVDVPGVPGMSVNLVGSGIALTPEYVAIYASSESFAFSTTPSSPETAGQAVLSPGSIHIRARYLTLHVDGDWREILEADPTYLVRFELRRHSDDVLIKQVTQWSGPGSSTTAPVDLWAPSVYLEHAVDALVAIERPPGTRVAGDAHPVNIRDKFDRAHPYVRWWYTHHYAVLQQGKMVAHETIRKSAVHKTDIRKRCKFCDYTFNRGTLIEPVDVLPPPPDASFRSALCPYCFDAVDRG